MLELLPGRRVSLETHVGFEYMFLTDVAILGPDCSVLASWYEGEECVGSIVIEADGRIARGEHESAGEPAKVSTHCPAGPDIIE